MSELAPKHIPTSLDLDQSRQFELIETKFERDPDGPLYSAVWDFDIDIYDLTHRRYPTDKDLKEDKKRAEAGLPIEHRKPVITTGTQLLSELFIQIDLIQPPERLKQFEDERKVLLQTHDTGTADSDHFVYAALDKILKVHHLVKSQLQDAINTYYSTAYWKDPESRTGLDGDELELLYDYTAPYEGQGLLHALHEIRESHAFDQDVLVEAERVARILVARETNMI